jgi:hypothetical protein
MTEQEPTHQVRETCERCGREAPPFILGPEGAAAQGWVTYEAPVEVVTADDPDLDGHPVILDVFTPWWINVCPDCQTPSERSA